MANNSTNINKTNNSPPPRKPLNTKENEVVSSNPAHDRVYPKQHYVIKFISDLRQVGGFQHQ